MCTGIKINYEDGCVMGRTMDYEVPLNYNVLYLPKNYNFCNDLMGNPLYSKYKTIGMCFENRDPLKDGVNEHGLIGITNDFFGFNLYSKEVKSEKTNISSLFYLTYALANYKTVEELVEDLPNIHISIKNHKGDNVLSPDFHFMFADSTKRCVVIEPKRTKLICYENPYDVMTNSPSFESHVKRLNQLLDLENFNEFNAAKNLPGGYDPISRFIKSFYLTKMNVKSNSSKEALSNSFNILAAMTLPNGFIRNKKYNHTTFTRYISSYDSKDKLLTVKSSTNPNVYQLGFEDIEDRDNRQAFFLDLNFVANKLRIN
ncbi:linear amide C-N hydrolase [Paratissierella segnis]|jgi:choloylglycine hydrolase|uniref:Linear amide C-N hydrolase n=1 Tax=Paratissierella segnis TaxID=2763679 RepID=A0A926IIC4_9FIRM|nr:linear amide C-N hydrolase [Paratissierella segnis]MBC8586814.1 linear amide C-N hydrolase [Paratissierella segnis]